MGVPEQLADRSLAEQHEYLRSKFSRRTMMRGGAVTLGAIAGGAFVPGAASAAVPTQTGRTPATYPPPRRSTARSSRPSPATSPTARTPVPR